MPPREASSDGVRRPRARSNRRTDRFDPDRELGTDSQEHRSPSGRAPGLFLDFLLVPPKPSSSSVADENNSPPPPTPKRRRAPSARSARDPPSSSDRALRYRAPAIVARDRETDGHAGPSRSRVPFDSDRAFSKTARSHTSKDKVPQKIEYDPDSGNWVVSDCWTLHGKTNCPAESLDDPSASTSTTASDPSHTQSALGTNQSASSSASTNPSATTTTSSRPSGTVVSSSSIMSDLPEGWGKGTGRTEVYKVPLIVLCAVILAGLIVATISISAVMRKRRKRRLEAADLELKESDAASVEVPGLKARSRGAPGGGGGGLFRSRLGRTRNAEQSQRRRTRRGRSSANVDVDNDEYEDEDQGVGGDDDDEIDRHQLAILREKYRAAAADGTGMRYRIRKFFLGKRRRRGGASVLALDATAMTSALNVVPGQQQQQRNESTTTGTGTRSDPILNGVAGSAPAADSNATEPAHVVPSSSTSAADTGSIRLAVTSDGTSSDMGRNPSDPSSTLSYASAPTTTYLSVPGTSALSDRVRSSHSGQSSFVASPSHSHRSLASLGLGMESDDDEEHEVADDGVDHPPGADGSSSPSRGTGRRRPRRRQLELPAYARRQSAEVDLPTSSSTPPPPISRAEDDVMLDAMSHSSAPHSRGAISGAAHVATDDKRTLEHMRTLRSEPGEPRGGLGESASAAAPEWTEEDDLRAVLSEHERSMDVPDDEDDSGHGPRRRPPTRDVGDSFSSSLLPPPSPPPPPHHPSSKSFADALPTHISSVSRRESGSPFLPPPPPSPPARPQYHPDHPGLPALPGRIPAATDATLRSHHVDHHVVSSPSGHGLDELLRGPTLSPSSPPEDDAKDSFADENRHAPSAPPLSEHEHDESEFVSASAPPSWD